MKKLRISYKFLRRGSDHSLSNGEGRYRAIERSGELNYSSNFDEHGDLQARNASFGNRNNNWYSKRGGKNGTYKGRRPGKYNRINNATCSDEG